MSLGLDLPGHGSGRAADLPRLKVLELCEQLIVEAMPVLDYGLQKRISVSNSNASSMPI